VIDNGALAFNRTDDLTVSNIITGTGTVAQNGTDILSSAASIRSWRGDNHQGTLKLGTSFGLGATNAALS